MKYKHLPKSFSKNFQDMNGYRREGSLMKWEQKFLKEQKGISYEEDKQGYKRLQEYDAKHGTNNADYFLHFHELWYWDNNETEWSRELRSSRRKDVYGNLLRADLMDKGHLDDAAAGDLNIDLEVSHSPSEGLGDMPKSSNVIPIRAIKSNYSEQDYQYQINPYSPAWVDCVIEKVDKERRVSPQSDIEVGLVKLPTRTSKWGYSTGNSELYVVSVFFPEEGITREAFTDLLEAKEFLEKLRNDYENMTFSIDRE